MVCIFLSSGKNEQKGEGGFFVGNPISGKCNPGSSNPMRFSEKSLGCQSRKIPGIFQKILIKTPTIKKLQKIEKISIKIPIIKKLKKNRKNPKDFFFEILPSGC